MEERKTYPKLDRDNPKEGYYFFDFLGWEIGKIYKSASGWRIIYYMGGDSRCVLLKEFAKQIEIYGPIPKPKKDHM